MEPSMSLTSGVFSVSPLPSARDTASRPVEVQQQAALHTLLQKYTAVLSLDASSPELTGLSHQIMAVAKAIGQIVELPHVTASPSVHGIINMPGTAAGNIDLKA
jgi:hypothetical protein